jgi:hypothetical protein
LSRYEDTRTKILRNSAKCALCGTEIESKTLHDYQTCECGEIYVDGGRSYLHRGFKTSLENFEDTSIIEEEVRESY